MAYESLFSTIAELVMCHSPSGVEGEIDQLLAAKFKALNRIHEQDQAGNIFVLVEGKDTSRSIAITAHKDEIGGMVKKVRDDGKIEIGRLGGSFPWVYGEGVVDLLGDKALVSGILSFGSRHVSHQSPQKVQQEEKPLLWQNAWVETKRGKSELLESGIRPGTRMVIGKHRKTPFRMGNSIASYTLDNKASLAIILELAKKLEKPRVNVYLVASAKEEVGGIGALHFTQRHEIESLIALEICPIAPEYPVESDLNPVLLSQDGYGLYDEALNLSIVDAARRCKIDLQFAALSGFGSDGSLSMKSGHVPRAACLSFPTENTHGFEIAHLEAIQSCEKVLFEFCQMERS